MSAANGAAPPSGANSNLAQWVAEGRGLLEAARWDEAEALAERIVRNDPTEPWGHAILARVYEHRADARVGAAWQRAKEAALLRLYQTRPDDPQVLSNMGIYLQQRGDLAAAIGCFRAALARQPGLPHANDGLLATLALQHDVPPQAYLAEARLWEQRCLSTAERREAQARRFARRDAALPLRVGFVSGDLRQHAVAQFAGHLIESLSATCAVHVYATATAEDAVTARLRPFVHRWVQLAALNDHAASALIRADGVDVLVDLAGYTGACRPRLFALRSAPVQAHYLGYYASTGLSEMDFFIGDALLTPPEHAGHFSEKLLRLPRPYCSYRPMGAELPDLAPVSTEGAIRFGSFNNIRKINAATMRLWSELLRRVPQATLVLKDRQFEQAEFLATHRAQWASHGMDITRLHCVGATAAWADHMRLYGAMDVALDPIEAHPGVTTTCDALSMGVPVLNLLGDRMGQRQSSVLLQASGLGDWVTNSPPDYLDRATAAAAQVTVLRESRPAVRAAFLRGPISDSAGMAQAFRQALHDMMAQGTRWA